MKKSIVIFSILITTLFSVENLDSVDCLILEDENSIVCKYLSKNIRDYDKNITVNWVSPNGEVSRTRDILVPTGSNSSYDFRYMDGREKGEWKFKVTDENETFQTTFNIE